MNGSVVAQISKNDARRAEIVERLADHVLAHGLVAASLRPLASAAGTSDRMLLYYFVDKAELIRVTLEHVAARLAGLLTKRAAETPLPLAALTKHLSGVVLEDQFWPYMNVWLELASHAGRKDPLYAPIAEQIGRGFLAWGEAQLSTTDPERRAAEAVQLLMSIEGLVLLKAIGLGDVAKQVLQ